MSNREEALRRIFEATGAARRLTDEQKRELLAHLEDAVETKVAAGVPEMDAVGQAFSELGDLDAIAKQFPAPAPAATTPQGIRIPMDGGFYGGVAFSFLIFFLFLQWFVTPKFAEVFGQVKVPLPGLSLMFLSLSEALHSVPVVTMLLVLAGAAAVLLLRRRRVPPAVSLLLLVVSVALCSGLVIALFMPLLSLLEGIR